MTLLAETDAPRQRVFSSIKRLGLAENIVDLDVQGLTVVPPEKTGATPDQIERLRSACLRFIAEREGRPADVSGGVTHAKPLLSSYFYSLFEDRVFEETLLNDVGLTLVTYLLGESAILSSNVIFAKGPTTPFPETRLELDLHNDNLGNPGPFHPWAELCNVTWLLSDYTIDNGPIGYVPGSHLLCRHNQPGEGTEEAVPIEAAAGSLLCWHGSTWHCSFPRKNPGLRLSYAQLFSRPYIQAFQPFAEDVTPEILARNPRRFRTLMGLDRVHGYRKEGVDRTRLLTDDGRMNSNVFWPTRFS